MAECWEDTGRFALIYTHSWLLINDERETYMAIIENSPNEPT